MVVYTSQLSAISIINYTSRVARLTWMVLHMKKSSATTLNFSTLFVVLLTVTFLKYGWFVGDDEISLHLDRLSAL